MPAYELSVKTKNSLCKTIVQQFESSTFTGPHNIGTGQVWLQNQQQTLSD